MKKKSILFITTSTLATNPRLVKEFETLKKIYSCYVLCFTHKDWSLEPSKSIISKNTEVNFILINRDQNIIQTLASKVVHKIAIRLNPFFKKKLKTISYASNDKTPQLLWQARRIGKKLNFDRIVAHNLGAFYPAFAVARQGKAKLQLDIEDYHPGELLYFNKKNELQNRLEIMKQIFAKTSLISYASEGIKRKCQEVFNVKTTTKQLVVINSFWSDEFTIPIAKKDNTLKLVWFSQNINANRGLEEVFEVAKEYKNIEIHLIGKTNNIFIEKMKPSSNVIIHNPMPQDKLHHFLSTMDVGLALESKEVDGNRDICLTNKFLSYTQAGLYIIASPTFGQSHFLEKIGAAFGKLIKVSLSDEIKTLDPIHLSDKDKKRRWKMAKPFSWDIESKRLVTQME